MNVLISCVNRFSHPSGLCRFASNLALCLVDSSEISKVTIVVGRWQMRHFIDCFHVCGPKIDLIAASCDNTWLSRYKWYYWGFSRLVETVAPDIVHFSFPLPFSAGSLNVPSVTTVHDLYAFDSPSTIGFPNVVISRNILRHAISDSSAVVCISHFTKSRLAHYFSTMKGDIRQAVIYQYVKCITPTSSRNNCQPPFFLSVAQHHKNKNLDFLIRAFGALHEKRDILPSTQLYLVGGTGPETEKINSTVIQLGLADRVQMLRGISDADLAGLYADCALYIAPSSIEGFCLPVVEASALSARIVCSDIPVLREVCADRATYFSLSGDAVNNLTKAIRESLDSPNGTIEARSDRYSLASSRDGYVGLYRKLLDADTV